MEQNDLGFYQHLFSDDEIYILEEGQELKDVCLILDKKLTAKNEDFLTKIMAAVHQSLFSVTQLYSANIEEISTLNTKKILIFDDEIFQDIPLYKITKINNIEVLKSNSLDALHTNKALKATLWSELQKFFN